MKKEYLVSAKEMKQLDENTITKTGIPSLVLMERAAFSVAMCVMEHLKNPDNKRILILCGNGNNGADGVCAGRILKEYGYQPDICVVSGKNSYTKEMEIQINAAKKYDISFVSLNDIQLNGYDVLVDAIFGIGLNRGIEGDVKQLIERINTSSCYVISVDIPSGINASDGSICNVAIMADETVTFGFYKCGQFFYPGRTYCGKLRRAKIGINATSLYDMQPEMFTYSREITEQKIDFPRNPAGNKGTFGKVLVIAGRDTTAGAALLCASSAFRSGCGMVGVITEEENKDTFLNALPEAMVETYAVTDKGNGLYAKLEKWTKWADVVVIGCGIGRDEIAFQLLSDTLQLCKKPVVCDADALQLFAVHSELKEKLDYFTKQSGQEVVFTPHPGELASLLHCSVAEIKENRGGTMEKACEEYGVILVAKDADTICGKQGEKTYLNITGNDGMATAGSGDVLAGLVASVIAQTRKTDISVYEAVCLAVFIHGYAADVCAKENGKRFLVASDIIEAYKYILK